MDNKGKYYKFWANTDNKEFLEGLSPAQKKGTVINEALRYYANMTNHTALVINASSVPSPVNLRGMAVSNLSQVNLASVASPGMTGMHSNFTPIAPAPASAICPNGHLWMNGTQRCVNKKCVYGKTA